VLANATLARSWLPPDAPATEPPGAWRGVLALILILFAKFIEHPTSTLSVAPLIPLLLSFQFFISFQLFCQAHPIVLGVVFL
jgi:hypothetical protein